MGERQEQQQSTIRFHGDVRHGVDAGIGDEHEIGMRQFNALRGASGSRRIYDGG